MSLVVAGADAAHYIHVGRTAQAPEGMSTHLHHIPARGGSEQATSLIGRTTLTRKSSLQESTLCAPRICQVLRTLSRRLRPAVEIYDTVRLGQNAKKLPAAHETRRLLYMDDLFSLRYARMLENLTTSRTTR